MNDLETSGESIAAEQELDGGFDMSQFEEIVHIKARKYAGGDKVHEEDLEQHLWEMLLSKRPTRFLRDETQIKKLTNVFCDRELISYFRKETAQKRSPSDEDLIELEVIETARLMTADSEHLAYVAEMKDRIKRWSESQPDDIRRAVNMMCDQPSQELSTLLDESLEGRTAKVLEQYNHSIVSNTKVIELLGITRVRWYRYRQKLKDHLVAHGYTFSGTPAT